MKLFHAANPYIYIIVIVVWSLCLSLFALLLLFFYEIFLLVGSQFCGSSVVKPDLATNVSTFFSMFNSI